MRWLLSLLPLLLPSAVQAQLPADVEAAYRDALKQPEPHLVRYLSFGHLSAESRANLWYLVTSVNINELSTSEAIYRPVPVDGTGAAVVRIDLRKYNHHTADKLKVWEQLADADPFCHVKEVELQWEQVEKDWPGGVWKADGKYYDPGSFRFKDWIKVQKAVRARLFAGMGNPATLSALANLLKTEAPILMGDWFYNQTCTQQRTPGYYDFLGIKDERSYQLLGGLDVKQQIFEDFANRLRGSLIESGITTQPRAFLIRNTLTGGLFATFDFELAVKGKDPLRILGKGIERLYTASEQYLFARNGLFYYGLFNQKGERQKAAPPQIATDKFSNSNHREVLVGISCKRCHTTGLQPISEEAIRGGAEYPLQAELLVNGKEESEKLRREYFRAIGPELELGRARFGRAVKEATGWTVPQYSAKVAEAWQDYEDNRCNIWWVAARAGVDAAELNEAIDWSMRQGRAVDPVLRWLLVRPRIRQRAVGVRQAEEVVIPAIVLVKSFRGTKK